MKRSAVSLERALKAGSGRWRELSEARMMEADGRWKIDGSDL